jgi:uncharacterized protein (TIGR03382 family)
MHRYAPIAVALACAGLPSLAWSSAAGIAGYSGKQGLSCLACHTGDKVATATLVGPTTLAVGQRQAYRLDVTGEGGPKVGGFNAALDRDDASLVSGPETKLIGTEITHLAPKDFRGKLVSFGFIVQAPSTPGPLKIFAAGLAANGDGVATGDNTALAQLTIQVTDGTPPIDPGPNPDPIDPDPNNPPEGQDPGTIEPGTGPGSVLDGPTRTSGGCGSGPAGVLAPALVAAAAWLRRRRGASAASAQ